MERHKRPHHNLHHTIFYRAQWESMADLTRTRRDSRLIVPMDIDAHSELHRNVAYVPPLSQMMANSALRLFNDYKDARDPITNLQNYMSSVEQAAKHPRVGEIERSIADLTVWACEQQIPFIEDGYVDLSMYASRAA